MLPRQYSLKNQADFESVGRGGRKKRTVHLLGFFLPNNLDRSRFGVIIGKKVSVNSVNRNRLRRQLLAEAEDQIAKWNKPPFCNMVVMVMKQPENNDGKILREELREWFATL